MKTSKEIFDKHFFHSKDEEAILQIMEEYAHQQLEERDNTLLEEMAKVAGLEIMKESLEKELSDFKVLVRQHGEALREVLSQIDEKKSADLTSMSHLSELTVKLDKILGL